MRRLLACVIAFASAPAIASAQFPPPKLKNLQVFPDDIPVRALPFAAKASYQRAVALNPNDMQVKRMLDSLTRKP